MKKTTFSLVLLLTVFVFGTATAQLKINVRANIGAQPAWGPTGYDHVDYYYMPDINAYYYVPGHQYIYQQHGHWIHANTLPYRYHNYDVYKGYKVVVNESLPYRHDERYRTKYANYKGRHDQDVIRDSHDSKYFEVKDHPEHDKWKKDHKEQNDDHNQRKNKS